jgi:hypothetical protein
MSGQSYRSIEGLKASDLFSLPATTPERPCTLISSLVGPRGASRSTARLLQNARDGQKLGESFKCPESFKTHTLPHPYLDKYVPKTGSLRMQGALVNEKITDVACLPGDNGCV